MTTHPPPTPDEAAITKHDVRMRVMVIAECDVFVALQLERFVASQGETPTEALRALASAIDLEDAYRRKHGLGPSDAPPAPDDYWSAMNSPHAAPPSEPKREGVSSESARMSFSALVSMLDIDAENGDYLTVKAYIEHAAELERRARELVAACNEVVQIHDPVNEPIVSAIDAIAELLPGGES